MSELREIVSLTKVGKCLDPGKAPEVVFLTISQLRINDAYQRSMTVASQAGMRRMAKGWDWNRYQPISVATTDDDAIFEVTDGQRRAIAAACNGNIHILPCYLVPALTLADKAAAFVGVNQGKVGLTPANVYKGRLVAADPVALAVQAALDANACRILDMPPAKGIYKVGDTMAVGSLMALAKDRDSERVSALIGICKAAGCAPISAKMLKALNLALPYDDTGAKSPARRALTQVIGSQGAARLEMIANSRTAAGRRDYETLADMLADMAKLKGYRLGLKSRTKVAARMEAGAAKSRLSRAA
jgi:hypothetical protein